MKIAILGYGIEGKSVHKFLKKDLAFKNAKITILDQKRDKNYLKKISDHEIIFRSPGVPFRRPEIKRAMKKGVVVTSATKLFFDRVAGTIIGITGSKGKGTTASLLYEILNTAGKPARLAGNIGIPVLDILPTLKKGEIIILELSSFQLEDLTKSPEIATILDIFPEHQDVHKNIREYTEAKTNICRYQKQTDAVFYFKDSALSTKIATTSPGKKFGVVGDPFELKKNFVMASTIASYLGCDSDSINKAIKKFRGLEYRFQLVRTIKPKPTRKQHSNILQNVRMLWYNDSASTNPNATALAIKTLAGKGAMILIAGGTDKNLDYKPIARAIRETKDVKHVILMGKNRMKIKKAISNLKLAISEAKDLKTAVKTAHTKAKSLITNHQLPVAILFSPGSASFDMFKDYKDRGEKFTEIVRKLK